MVAYPGPTGVVVAPGIPWLVLPVEKRNLFRHCVSIFSDNCHYCSIPVIKLYDFRYSMSNIYARLVLGRYKSLILAFQ